jgi:hypothetical protein
MQSSASLERSVSWLRWLRRLPSLTGQKFMLVVQNGMEASLSSLRRIWRVVGPAVGIFVGGDTEWKLATMGFWSRFAHRRGGKCHVGRVNSMRRIEAVGDAGADSFDGSPATSQPISPPIPR